MNYKQEIGKFGEILAKNFLLKHGYRIIATNIKTSHQEIDIIAYFKGIYIFVEVKTRTSAIYGQADETVYSKKIHNLKKAITIYLNQKKIITNYIRLDLISIDINRIKKSAKIKHYKDIF